MRHFSFNGPKRLTRGRRDNLLRVTVWCSWRLSVVLTCSPSVRREMYFRYSHSYGRVKAGINFFQKFWLCGIKILCLPRRERGFLALTKKFSFSYASAINNFARPRKRPFPCLINLLQILNSCEKNSMVSLVPDGHYSARSLHINIWLRLSAREPTCLDQVHEKFANVMQFWKCSKQWVIKSIVCTFRYKNYTKV